MALVTFKRGLKENLPSVGQDGVLYITTDTNEMFKGVGDGNSPIKLSDIIFVHSLPEEGMNEKIYVTTRENEVGLHVYFNGEWLSFSGTGGIDEKTLYQLLGFVNKVEELSYDEDGNITEIDVTGDFERKVQYSYNENGDIKTEEVEQGDKKVTTSFSYNDKGEIVQIETVVTDSEGNVIPPSDGEEEDEALTSHMESSIASEYGVHDFRYHEDKLQIYLDGSWKNVSPEVEVLTAKDIKELYESNIDTNAFTDDEKNKLSLIKDDEDGNKFLANDGEYKELESGDADHYDKVVSTEHGVHGIRFHEDELQIFDGAEWHTIQTGGVIARNVTSFIGEVDRYGDFINISWNNPNLTDPQLPEDFLGVELYLMETTPTSGNKDYWAENGTLVYQGTNESFDYEILSEQEDTILYFRIFANYDYEETPHSNGSSIEVLASDTTPPGNITNLIAQPFPERFEMTYTDPTDQDWVKTVIMITENDFQNEDYDGEDLIYTEEVTERNKYQSTPLEITGLTNDITYYIRLFPIDDANNVNRNVANKTTVTPMAVQVSSPTNLEANTNDLGDAITVTWTNGTPHFDSRILFASQKDITGFSYSACVSDEDVDELSDGVGTGSGSSETFNHEGLSHGETWFYKVFTRVTEEGIDYYTSAITSEEVVDSYSHPVTNLQASPDDEKVILTWNNPTYGDLDRHVIVYKQGSLPEHENDRDGVKQITDTNVEEVEIDGLINDEEYYFRFFTYDVNGNVNVDVTVSATIGSFGIDIGSDTLVAGDETAGFYGEVSSSDFISGNDLASEIGLSSGTSQHSDAGWLKYIHDGKIKFIAKRSFRHSISWDAINIAYGGEAGGAPAERIVNIKGHDFKLRFMRGVGRVEEQPNGELYTNSWDDSDRASIYEGIDGNWNPESPNEWNTLLLPVHEDSASGSFSHPEYAPNNVPNWANYTDTDLNVTGNGRRTWTAETIDDDTARRVYRGDSGSSFLAGTTSSTGYSIYGWRPVLEWIS